MVVGEIKSKAEFDEAVGSSTVLVIDAFAEWCGPCKAIAPQVEKFSETYKNARFVKIDVDEQSELAQELGVRAMPTFIIFKDGKKVKDVVGANPRALEAAITEALA